MPLSEYEELLNSHNWNFRNENNIDKWRAGHKEYSKLINLSFTTNTHRIVFKQYKVLKGVVE